MTIEKELEDFCFSYIYSFKTLYKKLYSSCNICYFKLCKYIFFLNSIITLFTRITVTSLYTIIVIKFVCMKQNRLNKTVIRLMKL